MKNAYGILGVPETASEEEIRKAYKKLVKEKHPDQNKSPTAQQEFEALKNSFDILIDPDLRSRHDLAISKDRGKSIPEERIDASLADWFEPDPQPQPQPRHQRVHPHPRHTAHPHDRRMPDEILPDGFLD